MYNSGRHTGEKPSAYSGTSIMTPGFNLGLRNTPTEDIWRSGIDWDETIEADAHKKWLKWVNDVKKHRSEYLDAYRPATPRELHVFVDASEKSYAAAVYWRIKLNEHETSFANSRKARVAP
ncbi:hypothetical protein EVAR_21267_1 [Eumeta japonica]|uniref:Reverse transcriptase/retrotransposon-derived protein RNase H-like domain-containing protein n=1 Tax=Eumeta variegata TaxID=151549 RepID=A0A4C1WL05_EUMVA|nr:hypothetical protein EVAR_21267_1 [Eumeta japonica]